MLSKSAEIEVEQDRLPQVGPRNPKLASSWDDSHRKDKEVCGKKTISEDMGESEDEMADCVEGEVMKTRQERLR